MKRWFPTAEMTVGPFFPRDFSPASAADLTSCEGVAARGEKIELVGRVTQADGKPLDNLVVELWQADANGIYSDPADPRHAEADPGFYGWGRAATNKDGEYRFRTVRPGARDGRAPHLNLLVLFSGLMHQLRTTLYFAPAPGDASWEAVQPAALRERLVARDEGGGRWRFDIRLRGDGETPFFDD